LTQGDIAALVNAELVSADFGYPPARRRFTRSRQLVDPRGACDFAATASMPLTAQRHCGVANTSNACMSLRTALASGNSGLCWPAS